jgi:hypothetical protein
MSQPQQQQDPPGTEEEMAPNADHGRRATRARAAWPARRRSSPAPTPGIGRAVAIAFAREGADVVIAYLDEHEDAQETARHVEEAGQKAVLVAGDLSKREDCYALIDKAVEEFGGSTCSSTTPRSR